jgi:hypothetical protein
MDSNPRSPGSGDTPQRPLIISPAITFRESSACDNPKPIDLHYDTIQAAMRGVFHELGLAA